MFKLKKSTKIWIGASILGALLLGGALFTFCNTSVFSSSWNILSSCKFNPEVSEKNKALIDETITTVANESLFSLIGEKTHLEEMGTILTKEVPDLAYWAYILSNSKLAEKMLIIQESSLKYNGFIIGTRDRLMREYQENPCLLQQAEGFAKYLKIPKNQTVAILKECIDNDSSDKYEFKKFMDYIINETTTKKSDTSNE